MPRSTPKPDTTPDPGAPGAYTPPSNPEAEQSVLGALLVRPEMMDEVADILESSDFYREAHGRIWQTMMYLWNNNRPIDLVTVTMQLKEVGWLEGVGGPVFLAQLSEQVGFACNVPYYAKKVRDLALLRRLLETTQEIAGACFAPVEDVNAFISAAEEKIYSIRDEDETAIAYTLEELIPETVERLEQAYADKREVVGIPSGYEELDAITAGWQDSDSIILAARPSMGKTALALNFAFNAAHDHGVPTAFFSLEQPKEQLIRRLIASVGEVNATKLRSASRLSAGDWGNVQKAAGVLMDTGLHIIDKAAMTTLEIRGQARRLQRRYGVRLLIIDYLQLVKLPGKSQRQEEVSGVSRALKALAKELSLPVISLAQLSRKVEERPNKRPQLSDLRESGSIEQDADEIIFIYRDEIYRQDSPDKGYAELNVAKQRNGPTGLVKLAFLAEYMRFQKRAAGFEEPLPF